MTFPSEQYRKQPLNELFYFDYEALCAVINALPDPVVARLANMSEPRVRGNIFGAVNAERSSAVKELINREAQADPEKDDIVVKALIATVNRLLNEKKIRREEQFYCAS